MGVNSLPKTVTRQRRGCDLKPGPTAPEYSTLATRLPSSDLLVIVLCDSAECEARRLQKEREREDALQQRLIHQTPSAADRPHQQLHQHHSAVFQQQSASPAALSPVHRHTIPTTTPTVTPTHSPARAPMLSQIAGKYHIGVAAYRCIHRV